MTPPNYDALREAFKIADRAGNPPLVSEVRTRDLERVRQAFGAPEPEDEFAWIGARVFAGIPIFVDATVPANILRFMHVDGTHEDVFVGPPTPPTSPESE